MYNRGCIAIVRLPEVNREVRFDHLKWKEYEGNHMCLSCGRGLRRFESC